MERRSLLDGDATPTREMENLFGDEFEVDDFDIVADGFRPSDHDREESARGAGVEEQQQQQDPVRTGSAHYVSRPVSPITAFGPSRNSIRKPARNSENPFASPDDGMERTPSLSFEPEFAHRSVSSASSHQIARTSSPRFGAGPSHPYGMYPQNTIPRSSSGATSSAARQPQRQSSLREGPQHPYSLYPQGVGGEDEDDDEDDALTQNPVPVGFIGLGQSYQRRLGPDGEEQDIVGEDGHTEQLPPYTRYPEDGPEKVPLLGVPAPPTALHSRAPVAGTDPTMELMHNSLRPQITPVPQIMTDASTLVRQPSVRSVGDAESHPSSSDLEKDYDKKSWREKSWKEKRKTRFCGIPFWWILLSFSVIAFIVAVLGGVIGGFVNHQQQTHHHMGYSTSLYDASAIATPASLAPPTGTYSLSLSTPQQIQSQCLIEADQQAAWSCNLAGDPDSVAINVGTPPGGNQSGAFLYYNSNDQEICYGAQMSWMESTYAPFFTVQDNDSPNSGPAYYFQQLYNKLVVVPENAITVLQNNNNNNNGNDNNKRQAIQLDQAWLQRKQVAQPGEKPWFCVWNNTLMEAFIYVQQPVAPSFSLNTAISNSSMSTPTPPPTSSIAITSASTAAATSTTSSITSMTTTFTAASTTATTTFTGPASSILAFVSNIAAQQAQAQPSDTDHDKRKRQVDADDMLSTLGLYPYVIKVEERRLSGNTAQPYCQQYQILNDGSYNWVANENGTPIIVYLDESDPNHSAYKNSDMVNTRKLREKRLVLGGCHCQWISGQSA